ncbi:OadG family protein [Halomonas denitrificans]|uniref:OadG family transporter subunit n=1 Tax=Halomonas TaxID=2745 RepID=UPI001A8F2AE9|nr:MULTISPECIES: OadG family transporter subunit [Halomonas]MBN8411764.1 OadG family protein [Halomonas litopenaei]MBY5923725.1 OadG family protein [Halomonas sp. DP4Y7-2]MBY5927871.1 OadG family protein [Halomonas sp. DP8Y7-3]MBY5967578.1 OadG family protein [Halomonas denitrificans]MBY5983082.1 OadG family protein [Halomonas sp. DP5Y7-2]
MNESQLVSEGLSLMALGMGFVFVFLTVLVVTTTLMSRVIGRFFPEPVAEASAPRSRAAPTQDDTLMAVIAAAVHRHRQKR